MAFRSRGLPSRGCNKCRSRKIGCDETKPTCQNCIRVGYAGCKYRDEFERTWRVHTEETVEKSTKQLQSKATACPQLARFFSDWASGLSASPGVSLSWFDALPKMYADADKDSLLPRAIEALAHVNYGKRFGIAESVARGAELYGEALRTMRGTLASNVNIPMRDVLASIVLLGIYEAYVDPAISPRGSWISHNGGASLLLKKQAESNNPSESPIDLQIRSMIFRQMLHGSLLSGQRPPISWNWDHTLRDPQLEPVHAHSSLLRQAAVLCSEWRTALINLETPSGLETLASLASQAISIDDNLDQWSQGLPPHFRYSAEAIAGVEEAPEWVRELLIHPGSPRFTHESASSISQMLWRFYWQTRMILSQALLYTNHVLSMRNAPSNPIQGRESKIELCLLYTIDRLCESCITPIVKALEEGDGTELKAEDIPSMRGYLMLQILPTLHVCLSQITLHTVEADLESRRAWVRVMQAFVQLRLGFSKAAAKIDSERLQYLPIQLWSLVDAGPGGPRT